MKATRTTIIDIITATDPTAMVAVDTRTTEKKNANSTMKITIPVGIMTTTITERTKTTLQTTTTMAMITTDITIADTHKTADSNDWIDVKEVVNVDNDNTIIKSNVHNNSDYLEPDMTNRR